VIKHDSIEGALLRFLISEVRARPRAIVFGLVLKAVATLVLVLVARMGPQDGVRAFILREPLIVLGGVAVAAYLWFVTYKLSRMKRKTID
jgi:hypothetical protein